MRADLDKGPASGRFAAARESLWHPDRRVRVRGVRGPLQNRAGPTFSYPAVSQLNYLMNREFYLLTFCWCAWKNCSDALWIDIERQECKRHITRVPPLMYKAGRFTNQGAGSLRLGLAIDCVSACSGDDVVESRS